MVSDISGGNWYRLWAIHSVNVDGGQVGQPEVVIVSDDKTHPFKLACASNDEADALAVSIASKLSRNEQPLWTICNLGPGDLPKDVLDYEMKRLQWYWKAPQA